MAWTASASSLPKLPKALRSRQGSSAVAGGGSSSGSMAEARPADDRDAAKDIARELTRIASELASVKGDAYNWLTDPNYRSLVHRIEAAHASVEAAAVEARRRVRMNEERGR